MTTWTSDELDKVGTAEELEIAPFGRDDTLRRPTTIWVVRVDDDIYVRAVNGRTAAWFRATQARHEGHMATGGIEKDVILEEVNAADNVEKQIDAAYRSKYRRYAASIVNTTLTAQARAATLRLVPRAASS